MACLPVAEHFIQDIVEIVNIIGAQDEIDVGQLLEKGVFFGIGHAAGDADDGLALWRRAEVAQFAHDFAFGQIADQNRC